MREKANSKRTQRAAIAGFILLASLKAAFAQGMDATDRKEKMDINREGAETRIERIHEDQERRGLQQKKTTKKLRKAPNRHQEIMQY